MGKQRALPQDGAERAEGDRPGRRFDRYELLISSAAEIFRSNGYDGTSLQQVADEVGILKGSLYHYIDTKEDLLYAIIKRNHDHIIGGNTEWRQFEDDPVAAIRSFVEGHLRRALWNPTYSEVFVRDFRALSPERAKEIRETQEKYDAEFRALVAKAVARGELRANVDPAFAARAVFGMANWIPYWYRPGGSLTVNEVVSQLSDYAMASLMSIPPQEGGARSS